MICKNGDVGDIMAPGKNDGYTLVELSLVLIIIGILSAGSFTAYGLYHQQSQAGETQEEITQIAARLEDFRVKYGRYPCPANMTARYGDKDFGREGSCKKMPNFVGQCDGGVCVISGERRTDEVVIPMAESLRQSITKKTPVLVGAVPAYDLGLDQAYVRDGYKVNYLYAVTADMAVEQPNGLGLGAIEILDALGERVLKERGNAAFILLSFGPNRSGSIGNPTIPCSRYISPRQRTLETENCDMDHVFRLAESSQKQDWSEFDDTVFFTYSHARPKWQPRFNKAGDLFNKHGDIATVTIGSPMIASDMPKRLGGLDYPIIDENTNFPKLEVHGAIRSEGAVISHALCDENIENCFAHKTLKDGGIECPDGQFMTGIETSQAQCNNSFECPEGLFIHRIDGRLGPESCVHLPAKCEPMEFSQCNKTYRLASSEKFQSVVLNIGYSKRVKYACERAQWTLKEERGLCACETRTRTRQVACVSGFSGHLLVEEELKCRSDLEDNGWQVIRIVENNCRCTAAIERRADSCNQGYIGELVRQRKLKCPQGEWESWMVVEDNCVPSFDVEQ